MLRAMDIEQIIDALGGGTRASGRLGLKRTTLLMWRARGRIPPQHVPLVARVLGVDPCAIWPELAAEAAASAPDAAA